MFAALLLLAGGLLFGARVGVADTEPAPPSTAPSVELDRLLKLPDSYGSGIDRRGGVSDFGRQGFVGARFLSRYSHLDTEGVSRKGKEKNSQAP